MDSKYKSKQKGVNEGETEPSSTPPPAADETETKDQPEVGLGRENETGIEERAETNPPLVETKPNANRTLTEGYPGNELSIWNLLFRVAWPQQLWQTFCMSAVLVGAIHYFDLWEFVGDVNEAFLSIDPILMKIAQNPMGWITNVTNAAMELLYPAPDAAKA